MFWFKNDCVTQYAGGTEGDTSLQKFNLISRVLRYLNDIPQVANKLVKFGSKFTKLSLQVMYSTPILSWEEVYNTANEIVFNYTKKYLNQTEVIALKGSYYGQTFDQMGENSHMATATVREVGCGLWRTLSKALKKQVKKNTFIQVLKHYKENPMQYTIHSQSEDTSTPMAPPIDIEHHNEATPPMDSDFYIERHNVESLCCKAITQDGALIRIRSPQRMGKTLLLGKLLDYATQQGYQTAKLDLQFVDDNTLADFNTFMKWLCKEVFNELDPQPNKEEYWQAFDNVDGDCTRFLQKYLLPNSESPLVLAIDSFEKLFKANIFSTFSSYLRGWHDKAKSGDRVGKIWRKLRVVLVYSTEKYPALDINHSPFNVGVAINLPDFETSEVTTLAKQYQLDQQLGEDGLSQLMKLVGGHPNFIQEAFANLKNQQMTLEELLRLAPTDQGIYSHYLRQQLWILQHNPQLESAYKKVVMTNEPVELDSEVAFKLHSLGLVKFQKNDCIPSYDLFVQYFRVHLG